MQQFLRFLPAGISIERDPVSASNAALRRDQHDAVGGARAVDACRSGVFQDRDGFNFIGIQVRHGGEVLPTETNLREVAGLNRRSVDYEERLVAGGQRRRASDANRNPVPAPTPCAPVTSARLLDPYPTTTTCDNVVITGCNRISAATVAPSVTIAVTVR